MGERCCYDYSRLGLNYEPVKYTSGWTFTLQLSQKYDAEEKHFDGTDMSAQDNSVAGELPVRATKQIVEGLIVLMQKPHPYSLLDSKTEIVKLELFLFVFPFDESIFSYLADVYIFENMDTTSYIKFLGKQVCYKVYYYYYSKCPWDTRKTSCHRLPAQKISDLNKILVDWLT